MVVMMYDKTLKLFPQEFDSFVPNENKKYFINFRFLEDQLTEKTKLKVIYFLKKLKRNKINFEILSPIPKCILGLGHKKTLRELKIPEDCSRCPFLAFDGDDDRLIFCSMIAGGRKIEYPNNGKIFNDLEESYEKLEFLDKCKNCLYRKNRSRRN